MAETKITKKKAKKVIKKVTSKDHAVNGVVFFYTTFKLVIGDFLNFIDKRKIFRRIMLGIVFYMNFETWKWAMTIEKLTVEQLGVLGAVGTLLGAMIKFYGDNRSKD